ncbi:UvrD-helicase domain-containing protein [Candidatus Peregrinibacteria bacterium]|jgi:DNA helicase II / ATP-dependent DNA helicase PcrA|nr:UvrD-helicase domain-containing protein [Candidatus Peregrinibacteria bacterium]
MSEFSEKILKSLNPEQAEAVQYVNGPLLVIAGAGSGKTRVLTNRIAYLIDQGIPPGSILAVTFTNKAAREMKERVDSLIGGFDQNKFGSSQPLIGTFHAVCLRFLRSHIHLLGYEDSFVIYDTADQEALMKRVLADLGINPKTYAPRAILSKISQAKNQLIRPEEFSAKAHNQFMISAAECYREYQKRLKMSQALDFDDIIMKTIELFQGHLEILEKYRDAYQYIMIDEYQDTNYAQYILITLLAEKYKNLMVVGDADQSIYGFRGANMSNILDFHKHFPGAKTIKLEQNYRSTNSILEVAHTVIEKNQSRHDKKMRATKGEGDKVEVMAARTSRDEALEIAHEIANHKRCNLSSQYSDFAVLYRTNAQSRIMEEAFMRYGVPYKIIGGVKFYSRKEIKDMIAYLRVIQNPSDIVSLLRIINTPPRKIGAKTIEVLMGVADQLEMSLFDAMSACEGISELGAAKKEAIKSFADLLEHLKEKSKEYNVAGLLKYLISETGYKEFLLENSEVGKDKDSPGSGQTRLENVHELISVASKYNELEPDISLSTFLEEVSLIAEVDNLKETDRAVVLMTIHSAKGLEFPNVFVSGLEEGLFPHFNSMMSPEDLEEERRLMYVAITRAEEKLYLSFAKSRMFYGDTRQCVPSQFLKDIPVELLEGAVKELHSGYNEENSFLTERVEMFASSSRSRSGGKITPITQRSFNTGDDDSDGEIALNLKIGNRVRHKLWGDGKVIEVRGGIVTIHFDKIEIGTKKLAINIAPIVKIS